MAEKTLAELREAAYAVQDGDVPRVWRAMADAMERLQRRSTGALLHGVPELCVCTHPREDHSSAGLCTAVPGVLGCGCLGWRVR